MMYPLPRTVLSLLASHGPAAVQLEALRLLDLPIPAHFPTYSPASKEWLLRRPGKRQEESNARPSCRQPKKFSLPD